MLVIRKEQWEALAAASDQAFHRRAVNWLSVLYPHQFSQTDSHELDQIVIHGIENARGYGLESEEEILFFLELVAEYGSDFEHRVEHHRALALLEDDELESSDKVLALADYRTFSGKG